MPIQKDLSDLPQTPRSSGGLTPDESPRFGTLLAERWKQQIDTSIRETAFPDTRLRHSQAGMCSRAIYYQVMGEEETNPLTVADYWRMGIGTAVHDWWQRVLEEVFPGAEIEMKVRIDPCDSSGHIDAVVRHAGMTIAIELKTINGYGFKRSIGARGEAEGPKAAHRAQAFINGFAVDADEVVIVYASLENLSPRELKKLLGREPLDDDAHRRFIAEWTFTKEQYWRYAEAEIARLASVLYCVDEGLLPHRVIPDPQIPEGGVIVDPSKGRWEVRDVNDEGEEIIVGTGATWQCDYCSFQDKCFEDGEGNA